MPAHPACPNPPHLRALLQGQGSPEEIEQAARHVEQCARCPGQVDELLAQTSLIVPNRPPRPAPEAAEQVEVLVDRVVRLRRDAGPAETENAADIVLTPSPDPGPTVNLGRPLPPAGAPPVPVPSQLGSYRLLRVLGEGGMGTVYLAHDTQLGRDVALKVIRTDKHPGAAARQRFLREARALAGVHNDHVVAIHHVGVEGDEPYFVMEYLRGESLSDRLKREPVLPVAEILRIGAEVADGLAAAHERRVVHRDVKPDNIWLEAPTGRAKLIDFGLARAADDTGRLTHSGVLIGTPAYVSPEQAQNGPLDERSDLFSLGCVLYRLCTGRMPFRGTDSHAVLASVATEVPTPPRDLNPAVPPALSDLVLRLLAKDPAARPATARDVAAKLTTLAAGQRARARRPRRALLALGGLAALIALAWVAVFRPHRPEPAADDDGPLTLVGRVNDPALREVGGLCESRRHAHVIWTVTNLDAHPLLYAVELGGRVDGVFRLRDVHGISWDALAGDTDGRLYIGDTEASLRDVPDGLRTIYRLREPDLPAARPPDAPPTDVPIDARFLYRPPYKAFDSKAIFYRDGDIYLFNAGRSTRDPTRLFRLPLDRPGQVVDLAEVCTLPTSVVDVRDAAVSPDGRRLAVCNYTGVALFDLKPGAPLEQLGLQDPQIITYPARRIEGCYWDKKGLVLAGDLSRIYRLSVP